MAARRVLPSLEVADQLPRQLGSSYATFQGRDFFVPRRGGVKPPSPQNGPPVVPFYPFLGLLKQTTGKSWHPYSNLSTGGPSGG